MKHHVLGGIALAIVVALSPRLAAANFHAAVIDEVVTSWDGDPTVQFVEIRMLNPGQGVVGGSELGVFDAAGVYTGKVLDVPTNVSNETAGSRWIMGSSQFATEFALTPDFTFSGPIFLPTTGGMVCWGKPSTPSNPDQYVDCLAYGTYAGPSNSKIGTPTSLDGIGHSLQRTIVSSNNHVDFTCADPSTPQNNAGVSAPMAATTSCPPPPTPAITCPATPLAPCKTPVPEKGSYSIGKYSDSAKRSMSWKWAGQATTAAEFGDPTATEHFIICGWDGADAPILSARAEAGGTCSGKPCWKASGNPPKGYKYKFKAGAPDGITAISVKEGVDGKAKMSVKAKGSALVLGSLPIPQSPGPLRIQLINSLGSCWGASYSSPPKSDPAETEKFKDKND